MPWYVPLALIVLGWVIQLVGVFLVVRPYVRRNLPWRAAFKPSEYGLGPQTERDRRRLRVGVVLLFFGLALTVGGQIATRWIPSPRSPASCRSAYGGVPGKR